MEAKLFEIRDSMTFIPVLVVALGYSNEAEQFLLRRSGFALSEKYYLMAQIIGGGGQCSTDPYDFGGSRTLQVALDHIQCHWDELSPGAVIDVQFILEETTRPKQSERITAPF